MLTRNAPNPSASATIPANAVLPIIERVIEVIRQVAHDVVLITNTPELYQRFGLPMFADVNGNFSRDYHAIMPDGTDTASINVFTRKDGEPFNPNSNSAAHRTLPLGANRARSMPGGQTRTRAGSITGVLFRLTYNPILNTVSIQILRP